MRRRSWLAPLSSLVVLAASCTQASDAPSTPSAPPSTNIPPLVNGALEPGTYALGLDRYRITFSVPTGWDGWVYGVIPSREGPEPPTGRGIGFWLVDNIYADPCRWDRGLLDSPPEASADSLAAALKAQSGRYATPPTIGELNGTSAIEMDLTVPPGRFSNCAQVDGEGGGVFLYWPQRGSGGHYAQAPGQREHLWILELDGARLVVGVSYFRATSAADRDELWDIVQSVQVS